MSMKNFWKLLCGGFGEEKMVGPNGCSTDLCVLADLIIRSICGVNDHWAL